MIAALAKAARVFDEPDYLAAAERAAAFILTNLRRQDGRLLHRYRGGGDAGLAATLDDYAFMIWALIEVYEASFTPPGYLKTAVDLSRDLIAHYWDCNQEGSSSCRTMRTFLSARNPSTTGGRFLPATAWPCTLSSSSDG
ncbi:hypothetical protein [Methanoculleus chikugoensis]|uniref:hypothetical protein n=1 Tax=Methanoculleus chikugoensis TaxID=118126 RepID=UPI000A568632|nr:hypothetical protein [Methanoculleus chikugoensis]